MLAILLVGRAAGAGGIGRLLVDEQPRTAWRDVRQPGRGRGVGEHEHRPGVLGHEREASGRVFEVERGEQAPVLATAREAMTERGDLGRASATTSSGPTPSGPTPSAISRRTSRSAAAEISR
ncbi:hypothetical protein SM611_31510 [Actinomadura sp. DLS-62]|uniref:Uncharacterized protein n=1 Tax=Actinomadura monticuli TaxID=3097367 RepID=A0ABV4QKF1_9ACTN